MDMTIGELVARSVRGREEKGFETTRGNALEKLCLVHSEVSEAAEDARHGRYMVTYGADGKPEGFIVELADVVIRIADLAGSLYKNGGEVLAQALDVKLRFNLTRPHLHGTRTTS